MSYEVEVKNTSAFNVAAVKFRSSIADLGQHMGPAFGAVMEYLGRMGIQDVGNSIAIYDVADEGVFDVAAGFIVPSPVDDDGHVVNVEVPAAEAALTTHMGPYEGLSQAYEALQSWMQKNDRQPAETMWEEYVAGPDSPPAEMRTGVYWALKPR